MDLVEKAEAPSKKILAYKFSQDHLELFLVQFDRLGDLITISLHSSLQLHANIYCLEAAFKEEIGIAKQESRLIFSLPLAIHATQMGMIRHCHQYQRHLLLENMICQKCHLLLIVKMK